MRLLIEWGANVNAESTFASVSTPLLMACVEKHADIVRLLLDAHADPDKEMALAAVVAQYAPQVMRVTRSVVQPNSTEP